MLVQIVLAIVVVVLIPVIMAFRNRSLQRSLEGEFGLLKKRVLANERKLDKLAAENPVPDAPAPKAIVKPGMPSPLGMEPSSDRPGRGMFDTSGPSAAAPMGNDLPRGGSGFGKMESDLSSKWMIWVGGIALALGGGFLVKYSIDANLLPPLVRVSLGGLLGALLILGGELIRRNRGDIGWLEETPDYLPGAVSAAGFFTLFATVYGAYALYQLVPALIAFGGLAAIAIGASVMALMQGRFFAYLGLVGGMVAPALVSTADASAWALFPYLGVISATSLWVSRQKAWIDVVASSIVLALLWAVLWMLSSWHNGDVFPVGLYLLTLGGLNAVLLRGASPARSTDATLKGMVPTHLVTAIYDVVAFLCLALIAGAVRLEHYNTVGLVLFAIALGAQAYAVTRNAEHDSGGLSAQVVSLFLLATWHVPDILELQQRLLGANEEIFFGLSPIAPPGFVTFVITALLLASAVGYGLYLALPLLLRKPMWASVGAALPIAILIVVYGRLVDFDTSIPFAAIATGLSGLLTLAATQISKRDREHMRAPVAAYAAGAALAMALAFTMLLRDAWLSFALAFEVVALAHIWRTTRVRGLRQWALGIALIVLLRLFLNDSIFAYGDGRPLPVINWLFYGYGLNALLFAYAARVFRQEAPEDRLLSVLKAGAVLLLVGFTTLELRVIYSPGGQILGDLTAVEAAMQTINWGAATAILLWREIRENDAIFGYLRRFMTIVSLFGLLVGGGLVNNIFFRRVDVGTWPVLNLQLLQFFIPAVLYSVKAWMAARAGKQRSQIIYGGAAFFAFFLWVTVEVRHLFHPLGGSAPTTDWEWYSYSAGWLIYAAIVLFLGIRLDVGRLRMAALGLLGLVVAKVFFLDMNQLEGFARALSFLGLGVTLIGMGYLYQRLKQDGARGGAPDARSGQGAL